MRARHIRKHLEGMLEVETLQPGYLVITYDPAGGPLNPGALRIRNWDELKARGFFGGIVVPKGFEFAAFSDEELARAGLQRIPAVERPQAAPPPPDGL